jgi:hypothetical protein
MQQLKQTLQDQIDDRNIENDTPTTTFSSQPEHRKQKMKMKLEYDHSNPALSSRSKASSKPCRQPSYWK